MKDLRTLILAAGKGTRMKSHLSKVLHPVCGRPLIQYVFDVAKSVGSLKTCIVLGHQNEQVREALGPGIQIAIQKKLLGTADAVRCAQAAFRGYKGHVLVLCGDTPLLRKPTIRELIRKHKKSGAACTFLTAVVHDSSGYGRVIRGEKGAVLAIREETDATDYEKNIAEINVGVYCFKSELLFAAIREVALNRNKREFYLTDVVSIFADKSLKIETVETEEAEEGLGVNSREDLAFAEGVLRKRILSDLMLQGVTIVDPQTTYIHADVKIGRDTVIHPCTFIEENVKIGAHCSIGPFARLRPGTRIADHAEVGNFVEISRTQFGSASRAKHFSFLGDSVIGKSVNIGAGVVTANYDGVEKNKTYIADQAFIGSDSVLIAPVKVGRRAVTGAGCVVTKGKTVPDGGVIVGVPGKILSKKK